MKAPPQIPQIQHKDERINRFQSAVTSTLNPLLPRVQVIPEEFTTATVPTADATWVGRTITVKDAPDEESRLLVCLRTSTDGYAWFDSASYSPPRWDDLMVPESVIRPGTTAPALTTFKNGTRLYAFSEGDDVETTVQIPHGWKQGTVFKPHVHVSFPNANAGNYAWQLEYTIAGLGQTFGNTNTIETSVTAAPGAAYGHELLSFPDIDMSPYTGVSAMLVARLIRKSGVDTAYGSDIFLLEFDYHFCRDAAGSIGVYTKWEYD